MDRIGIGDTSHLYLDIFFLSHRLIKLRYHIIER